MGLKEELNLVAKIEGLHKVRQQLKKVSDEGIKLHVDKDATAAFAKITSTMDKDLRSIFKEARDLKLGEKAIKEMSSTVRLLDTRMASAINELESAQHGIDRMSTEATRARKDAADREVALIGKMISLESRALQSRMQDRERAISDHMDLMRKGAIERAQITVDSASDFVSAMSRGDFSQAGGIAKKAGEGMDVGADVGGGGMGALGKMLPKLVKGLGSVVGALGAIVAIAGPILMVAKAIHSVDSASKELNKTILEGAAVGDLYWGDSMKGAASMEKGLQTVRNAATDFFYNVGWRSSQEEIAGIIGAFNTAGVTVREMTKGVEDQEVAVKMLHRATSSALTYSKLLGVDQNEMASNMGEWSNDLALNLGEVEKGLATVSRLSMESGFGVKRFFTMVQQATTGVGLYNIRIEQAANLLSSLSKVMDPKRAAAFMQKLAGGTGGGSIKDAIQDMGKTGGPVSKRMNEMSASKSAKQFADAYGEVLAGAEFGIDLKGDKTGGTLIKALQGMSKEQQSKLLYKLSIQEEDGEKMVQQMGTLLNLTEGTKEGADMVAQAMATSSQGLGERLASELHMFGKPLHQLSGAQLIAFQEFKGMTTDQLVEAKNLSSVFAGKWANVMDSNNKILLKQTGDDKLRAEQLKENGVYLNEQGKLMSATLDEQGNIVAGTQQSAGTFAEYLAMQDSFQAATEQAYSVDEANARAQVRHTRGIESLIGAGTNALLGTANNWLMAIWGKGVSAKQMDGINAAQKEQADLLKELKDNSTKIGELQEKRDAATSGPEKQAIGLQIAALEQAAKTIGGKIGTSQAKEQQWRQGDPGMFDKGERILAGGKGGEVAMRNRMVESGGYGPAMTAQFGEGAGAKMEEAKKIAAKKETERLRLKGIVNAGPTSVQTGEQTGEAGKAAQKALAALGDTDIGSVLDDMLEEDRLAKEQEVGLSDKQVTATKDGAKDVAAATVLTTAAVKRAEDNAAQHGADAIRLAKAREVVEGLGLGKAGFERERLAADLAGGKKDVLASVKKQANAKGDKIDPGVKELLSQFQAAPTGADFMWRAGQGFAKFSPGDNIVGTKDGAAGAGGAGGGGNIVTVNINGGNQQVVYDTVKKALGAGQVRGRKGQG